MNENVSWTADYSCVLQTPTAPHELYQIEVNCTETKENNI